MSKRLKIKIWILVVLFLFATILAYLVLHESRNGILTVAFLDIGQGDSIFIESPSGNQMLVDGGSGREVLRELSAVMPFYDRSIDVLLATHADEDHIGGFPDVLERYEVNLFLETGNPGVSSSYQELEKVIDEKEKAEEIRKIFVRRGMVVDLGSRVELQILFPDRNPIGMETNTSSIVARLVYGENTFMLTGDSPKAIEGYLISLNPKGDSLGMLGIRSDVLKAGHHGSKTSTSAEFVRAVSPDYVVISAGKNNRYGHPNKEVLDILEKANVKIFRTDQDGRIIFESNGTDIKVR